MTQETSTSLWTPKWLLALPAIALLATFARWMLQGTHDIYSAFHKRYYIEDADLGWRVHMEGPIWLGLDSVVATLGVCIAIGIGVCFVRRRERKLTSRAAFLRLILWVVALISPLVPIIAFSTGMPIAGVIYRLPEGTSDVIPVGVHGRLRGLPEGRYIAADHRQASLVARLEAGGDVFEARFTGVTGQWNGDPADLAGPMSGEIEFAAGSVDTGISLRSKHARDELKVESFPRVRFDLGGITGVGQQGPGRVVFSAKGKIGLMGTTHDVNVTGDLRVLDDAGRKRLGGLADIPAFVVNAKFTIRIDQTPIGNDGTFSANEVPIQCTMIFLKN